MDDLNDNLGDIGKAIVYLFTVFVWLCGIIIANGFWSTFFAIIFPLWGWYLTIERYFFIGWCS